ncbi:MAG: cytochrome c biogenesis protein CcdA [Candidatus Magasanikbacteria bacterium]|nr:cytochrome c biogenesis protein CcdA [Candidatus Magasanikbacteria bacterium]
MDTLLGVSLIASFFAGMVALFAHCCITVRLPAYLAAAVRERQQILKMTFIFFAGIAVILIPIGLGAAFLARIFEGFHNQLYLAGGALMMVLAVMAILGKGLAMVPMTNRIQVNLTDSHPKSVFLLGIFSGAATSCCAPVLAGAVTLAVISGVFWKALLVTFAYVFGMTFPLFILAYFYDRFKLAESRVIKGKLFSWPIGGKRTIYVHSTNLLAGAIFFLMGALLLFLGFSGNAFWSPAWQAQIGSALNRWSQKLLPLFSQLPEVVWGLVILGIFFFLIYRSQRKDS